jgi:hypothetical protein
MSLKQMLVQILLQTLLVSVVLGSLFSRKLEKLRFEMRLRERAASIAELLAEWASKPTNPTPQYLKRLTQLNFELSIWLPAPIVRDLQNTLRNAGEKNAKEIVLDVRRFLRDEADDLNAEELVHFEPPKDA